MRSGEADRGGGREAELQKAEQASEHAGKL